MATYDDKAHEAMDALEHVAREGAAYPELRRLEFWRWAVRAIVLALLEIAAAIRDSGRG